jgi:hypothetical protein
MSNYDILSMFSESTLSQKQLVKYEIIILALSWK